MPACVTPRETSHSPKGNLVCIRIFLYFSSDFDHLSSYAHFSLKAKYVDTRRPSGTCGRGLSSIRALELTWCALKVFFFFRREWIRRFPGVPVQRIFIFIVHTFSFFLRRDYDPETSYNNNSRSSSAQSMLQPIDYNVTTLPRPAAAGNTMRV